MTTLAIETSAEPASLAIRGEDGHILSRSFANENQVNVPLADELAELLRERTGSITTVIAGAGPGSYSGARVGLATGEAVGMVHKCSIITLPSIYGVAREDDFTLIGDARRGAYFLATPSEPVPQILEKEQFLVAVESLKTPLVSFEKTEKLPLPAEILNSIEIVSSSASQLLEYWHGLTSGEQELWQSKPKEIIYLRPPNITKAKSPF